MEAEVGKAAVDALIEKLGKLSDLQPTVYPHDRLVGAVLVEAAAALREQQRTIEDAKRQASNDLEYIRHLEKRPCLADFESLRADFEKAWKIIEDAMPYIPGSSFVAAEIDELDEERKRWSKKP